MTWSYDPMAVVNLILSIAILIIGCWDYAKTKKQTPFFIGVAFGLFSLFHIITFFGIARDYQATLVLTQIFGYLIVLFTLL